MITWSQTNSGGAWQTLNSGYTVDYRVDASVECGGVADTYQWGSSNGYVTLAPGDTLTFDYSVSATFETARIGMEIAEVYLDGIPADYLYNNETLPETCTTELQTSSNTVSFYNSYGVDYDYYIDLSFTTSDGLWHSSDVGVILEITNFTITPESTTSTTPFPTTTSTTPFPTTTSTTPFPTTTSTTTTLSGTTSTTTTLSGTTSTTTTLSGTTSTTPDPNTSTTPSGSTTTESPSGCCAPPPNDPIINPPIIPNFTTLTIPPLVIGLIPPTSLNPFTLQITTTTTTIPNTTTTTTIVPNTGTIAPIECVGYCKKLGF